jgi:hypothetical protein
VLDILVLILQNKTKIEKIQLTSTAVNNVDVKYNIGVFLEHIIFLGRFSNQLQVKNKPLACIIPLSR